MAHTCRCGHTHTHRFCPNCGKRASTNYDLETLYSHCLARAQAFTTEVETVKARIRKDKRSKRWERERAQKTLSAHKVTRDKWKAWAKALDLVLKAKEKEEG